MKHYVVILSVAALSVMSFTGCSSSEGGADKPAATKSAAPAKAVEKKPAQPVAPAAAATAAAAQPAAAAATAAAADADPVAEAKNIFATRCVTCHGASGKGDGAAASALNPKPRDYTDKAWQASVTDEQLAKAIVEGGAAIGKSALMPANPDLKGKDAVVAEIVKLIRAFAK